MRKFLIQILINAVGLYVAFYLLKGTYLFPSSNSWTDLLLLAVIFGLVNTFIRPIFMTLGCPLIMLTLGLGTLLINTLMFWLAGVIGNQFGIGFTVNGFLGALFGAIIVSLVSLLLGGFLKREER
ncbi:MAG TPA: phage holin family protein [Bellilinea sp.]|nr:phage holin family protein [Bellilinea sp.]